MKKEETKFTVRVHPDVAKKLKSIAEYYGRSQNKQVDWLIKQCIIDFEKEHGTLEPLE